VIPLTIKIFCFNDYKKNLGGYSGAIFINFVIDSAGATNGNGGWL
jgi:hypothetical protein